MLFTMNDAHAKKEEEKKEVDFILILMATNLLKGRRVEPEHMLKFC